jgi:integrase/recombinase XerD
MREAAGQSIISGCTVRANHAQAGASFRQRSPQVKRDRDGHNPGYRGKGDRDRLLPIDQLQTLGSELLEMAKDAVNQVRSFNTHRDGLTIGLLAARPTLRLCNLTGLILGRTLVRRGHRWWIEIPSDESKNYDSIEASWPGMADGIRRPGTEIWTATRNYGVPEIVVPYFEYYVREVRPKFTGADRHDGVWASTKDGPLTANAIARVITERTRDAFGQAVNPHLFRHCAATTIAMLQPRRIGVARDLLGHASMRASCTLECLLELLPSCPADQREGSRHGGRYRHSNQQ